MLRFVKNLPFRLKVFFCINLFFTFLLVALYILSLTSLISYSQTIKFHTDLFNLLMVLLIPFIIDFIQNKTKTKPTFAMLNFVWPFFLSLVFLLNGVIWLSDPKRFIENAQSEMQAKTEGIAPEVLVDIAKYTYEKWLRLQNYSFDESNDLQQHLYIDNANTEVKVIDIDSIITKNYKRPEFKKTVLTYYISNIRNGLLYPVIFSWKTPPSLYQAERKASIGTNDSPQPYEQYDPNVQKSMVRVRATYMIAVPKNIEIKGEALTAIHDDLYIDMLISITDQEGVIVQELWEYCINTPKFPTDPQSTLELLRKHSKK